jgi:thiol-disulfide isomerase/thioredoxin
LSSAEIDSYITLVLKDSEGKTVVGANVGTKATEKEGTIFWDIGSENYSLVSDDRGRVYIDTNRIFPPSRSNDYKVAIYALHEEGQLAGLAEISKADKGREINVRMVKACKVSGFVDSSEIREIGHKIRYKYAVVYSIAEQNDEFLEYYYTQHRYDKERFEFLLPTGNYIIRYGLDGDTPGVRAQQFKQSIEVGTDRKGLDLGIIDLKATKLAKLIGKPAPELEDVREWKNGGPVKLSELRGKVVLLHFWIYSCDKGYSQMHNLINLYERVQKNNLDVEIIVIHDGRFDTIAQMEEAFNADSDLVKVREEKWDGKWLPFRIALDSNEPSLHLGGKTYLRGINWANYNIETYPITFLIDRKGILVGEFSIPITFRVDENGFVSQEISILQSDLALERLKPYMVPGIGEAIGKLDQFDIKLPQELIDDKMILVCFFDMSQRPSRNLITELSKQADELKQKGVIIVAVQASKIDKNALNEYVKKYNITFPVGMIEAEEEKTKLDWGVKSLPWLIMTDKEHIIKAEGFSLTELEDKIKSIN